MLGSHPNRTGVSVRTVCPRASNQIAARNKHSSHVSFFHCSPPVHNIGISMPRGTLQLSFSVALFIFLFVAVFRRFTALFDNSRSNVSEAKRILGAYRYVCDVPVAPRWPKKLQPADLAG